MRIEIIDVLDSDGCPTEETLKKISGWECTDFRGCMEFVKSIWAYADWGWHETNEADWIKTDKVNRVYRISTAGWSGNESIISALKKNSILWFLNWWESRRGGHFVFIEYGFAKSDEE